MSDSEDLPVIELGRPGPERGQGLAAIMAGDKTALTGLLAIHEHEGEPAPEPGQRFSLVDSAEGRGYAGAAQWRAAHEELFTSPEVSAYLGFTPVIGDDTLVVTERFRVI